MPGVRLQFFCFVFLVNFVFVLGLIWLGICSLCDELLASFLA